MIIKEPPMYETLMLSKEALELMLTLPNLPLEDRSRVELAIATIDLNANLAEQGKHLIGRDQNGDLRFIN
jgi:hypothetical protein